MDKKEQNIRKKMFLAAGLVLIITSLAGYTENTESIFLEEGQLLRQENGFGEYEVELQLEIDGSEKIDYSVSVPEQRLAMQMESEYLNAAIAEIENEFAGTNESLEEIRDRINYKTSYQNGKVTAEWSFSREQLIGENGVILEDAMQNEQETVKASVVLTCEDSSLIHEFYFTVYKKEKSQEELFYEKLNQIILEIGQKEETEVLSLPSNVDGHTLVWKEQKSELPIQIFLLGMLIVFLLPMVMQEREKEEKKKREQQLIREYPELVNKLALLLGAGMTLQGAWKQIVFQYLKGREEKGAQRKIAYEEMIITQREIESGKGEIKSYEAFGERCGVQQYRKLCNYLIQNLKKGNRRLGELLEREAEDALNQRRSIAQRYGEEAGTKLLFPMLLMLGIVVVVIMIPAVISFQSGVN